MAEIKLKTRNLETWAEEEVTRIQDDGLYRSFKDIQSAQGPVVKMDGKEVILLCSNNYLGLANHPEIVHAAREAALKYGAGSGASRYISGNMELYSKLEDDTAAFRRCEAALVFSTGYMANVGVISALAGEEDVIFSDELNHASVIDGCRLSGAKTFVYRHADMDNLCHLLKKHRADFRHALIITDSVFSMDGELAPLPDIISLARQFDAWTLVDDAHGNGVMGENGRGAGELLCCENEVDIWIGTYSKALGSLGGFVCAEKQVIELLRNRCRSLIYSTALPPSVLAASLTALKIARENPSLRERLWQNVEQLRHGFLELGYDIMGHNTHILPILTGDAERAMEAGRLLLAGGIYVTPIRPPSVPEGTSRLRVTVTALHTREHLNRALDAFNKMKATF